MNHENKIMKKDSRRYVRNEKLRDTLKGDHSFSDSLLAGMDDTTRKHLDDMLKEYYLKIKKETAINNEITLHLH